MRISMRQWQATLLGFLAASLLPAVFQATVFPLSGERDVASISATFLVAYWFSALFVGILGVPMFLILRRLGLVSWWSAAIGGTLGGVMVPFILINNPEVAVLTRFTVLGAVSGLLFWTCWRLGAAGPFANEPPDA